MRKSRSGFSLVELLTTMMIISILSAAAIQQWYKMRTASEDSAIQLVGFIKKIRAKAIASTIAHKITVATDTQIHVGTARSCTENYWTNDPQLDFNLFSGSKLLTTSWSVCYDTYGLSTNSVSFEIFDEETGKKQTIQVTLGGAVRRV